MDYNRPTNRPAAAGVQQSPATEPVATTPVTEYKKPGSSRPKRALAGTLSALVLLGAGFTVGQFLPVFGTSDEFSRVDSSKYQAVFLTNDQVYFGKVTDISEEVVVLKDIYYLQRAPGETKELSQETASPSATQLNDLSLAKLGNEIHGPQDQMQINRDQVLFWENMKDDGKVAQAIKNNKQ